MAQAATIARDAPIAHRSARRKRPFLSILRYSTLLIAAIFFLFPIFWIVVMSFKLPSDYLTRPPVWIPNEPTLNHYRTVMETKGWAALSYTHLRAHETDSYLVCRLLLEK